MRFVFRLRTAAAHMARARHWLRHLHDRRLLTQFGLVFPHFRSYFPRQSLSPRGELHGGQPAGPRRLLFLFRSPAAAGKDVPTQTADGVSGVSGVVAYDAVARDHSAARPQGAAAHPLSPRSIRRRDLVLLVVHSVCARDDSLVRSAVLEWRE